MYSSFITPDSRLGEFDTSGIQPKVSRVLGLMTPGGNLSVWKESFRSVSRDPHDPDDIRNWTWDRFRDELYDSVETLLCTRPLTRNRFLMHLTA